MEKIIVFRAVVPGMYTSDAEGGRASSRKKQPDTISVVVVENQDETRRSSSAVTCTHARTYAGKQQASKQASRHVDTRGYERKGVVGDGEGGERRERLAGRLVPLSMHADGLALY